MDKNIISNNLPLVSICIMVYNQEKYVERVIESALKQTYNNIEIIISNNGSTDQSKLKIQKFLKFENVKLLDYNNNNYITKVSNNIIRAARGEYICFIAGDDYYLPDYVEKNLNTIVNLSSDYGVVYSPSYIHNELTDITFLDNSTFNKSGDVFDSLIEAQVTGFIPPHTPFLRKAIFDIISHNEKTFCEGEAIYIRIAKHFKFQYIDIPLQVATDHENNHGKNYKENAQLFYDNSIKLISLYPEKEEIFKQSIGKMYLRNAWLAIRLMGDRRWMRSCLKIALINNPLILLNWKFFLILILSPLSPKVIDKFLFFRKKVDSRNALYIKKDYESAAE